MTRLLLGLAAASLLTAGTGCHPLGAYHYAGRHKRGYCDPSVAACQNPHAGPPGSQGIGPRYGGPATGAVTYPYYTVRGPRDFLHPNPPSVGR